MAQNVLNLYRMTGVWGKKEHCKFGPGWRGGGGSSGTTLSLGYMESRSSYLTHAKTGLCTYYLEQLKTEFVVLNERPCRYKLAFTTNIKLCLNTCIA